MSSCGSVPQNHFSGQYDTIIAQKQKETLFSSKSQKESGAEANKLFEKKVEWRTQKYCRKKSYSFKVEKTDPKQITNSETIYKSLKLSLISDKLNSQLRKKTVCGL